MERPTLTVLAVAAVAILAISLSAATLTSTVESEGDPSGGQLPGGEEEFGLNKTEPDSNGDSSALELPAAVEQLLMAILVGSVIGAVVHTIRSPRRTLTLILTIAAFGLLFWLLLAVLSSLDLFESGGDLLPSGGQGVGSGQGSSEGTSDLTGPLLAVLVGVLVAVLLGVTLLLRRDRAEPEPDTDPQATQATDTEDTTALGAIAGRTADRIEAAGGEDSETENEVYRAWRQMTDRLELDDPETATPREFQDSAVTAGMASEDVRELTRLFERVRYGGRSATEGREQRAVAVLRRIESTYGDEG